MTEKIDQERREGLQYKAGLFYGCDSLPETIKGGILTIGNFDGLHLGHQAILQNAKKINPSLPLTILVFDPHPRSYFSKTKETFLLTRFETRFELARKYGGDAMVVLVFDKKLASMEAQDFVQDILVKIFAPRYIYVGKNWKFGKDRKGSVELLETMAEKGGFRLIKQKMVMDENMADDENTNIISSSAVRLALRQGDLEEVKRLTHRYHSIIGQVIKGDHRGAKIGFPTANLDCKDYYAPCFGVYAVKVKMLKDVGGNKDALGRNVCDDVVGDMRDDVIDDDVRDDVVDDAHHHKIFSGIANFGCRPTFQKNAPLLEVHLFDFHHMIYGKMIEVQLCHFIRPERFFPSLDELKTQIEKDIKLAKQALGKPLSN